MKNLVTGYMVPEAVVRNASSIVARSFVARNMVKDVQCSSTTREAIMGNRKTEARQCKKVERHLLYRSVPMEAAILCNVDGKQSARSLARNLGLILGNQSVLASWKPANPPDTESSEQGCTYRRFAAESILQSIQ